VRLIGAASVVYALALALAISSSTAGPLTRVSAAGPDQSARLVEKGKQIFRFDTFGDE
jgi:hypothetical protein